MTWPFYSLFTLLVIFELSYQFREFRKLKKIFYTTGLFSLILFAGLREAGVGYDDYGYIEIFRKVHNYLSWLDGKFNYSIHDINMEYGFILLISFVKYLSSSYILLFMTCAAISVGLSGRIIYKLSPYIFISLLLYFSHHYLHKDLNAIRSAIASGILLSGIKLLSNGCYIKFILIIFSASLFHISSLIAFVPLCLHFLKLNRNQYAGIILMSLVLGYFGIANAIITIMPELGMLSTKLNYYVENKRFNYSLDFLNLVDLKNTIIIFIALANYALLKRRFEYFEICFIYMLSATLLRLLLGDFAIVAGRLASLLSIVEVLIIPMLICIFKNKIIGLALVVGYSLIVLSMNINYPQWGGGFYNSSLVS